MSQATALVQGNRLDVIFNLVRMTSAIYENVLNTGICEELESILNQWGVCER